MSLFSPWSGLRPHARQRDLWCFIDALGGALAAARAEPERWSAVGLPMDLAARLHSAAEPGDWLDPTRPEWPERLRHGEFAPVALAYEGNLALLSLPCVGVVGARRCTAWGRGWAARIGQAVADAGAVVVSGLARGIDAEAHLAARGRTIAVLGQGLGARMAVWQRELRERVVAEGGLILSEMGMTEPADTHTFPIRNRVIAGIAQALVVVEAGHRSGARNTATHAARLGRSVFALPGPPEAESSAGCLDLIEEGATVFRGPDQVLAHVGVGRSARVEAVLPGAPTPIGVLGALLGLEGPALLAYLGELELRGEVARLPGLRYARTQDACTLARPPRDGPSRE